MVAANIPQGGKGGPRQGECYSKYGRGGLDSSPEQTIPRVCSRHPHGQAFLGVQVNQTKQMERYGSLNQNYYNTREYGGFEPRPSVNGVESAEAELFINNKRLNFTTGRLKSGGKCCKHIYLFNQRVILPLRCWTCISLLFINYVSLMIISMLFCLVLKF